MGPEQTLDVLVSERNRLVARLNDEREQLERIQLIETQLSERIAWDEQMIHEIDSALGLSPQLCIEDADIRLRGRHLEEVAIRILRSHGIHDEPVHYRKWFALVRAEGHLVSGKQPVNTFLSQINRSDAVERVGHRTGLYRLSKRAA